MAAAYRRLTRPPIVEAVIGFGIRLHEPMEGPAFAKVSAEFKAKFPAAMLMRQRAVQMRFEPGEPDQTTASESLRGVRFDNDAKDRVAIFAVDGFSFSHVNTYSDWATFKSDALAAWNEYCHLAKPQEIVRVGLRYINRFDFDSPLELNEYFTAAPSLPPDLPQTILGPSHSQALFPLPDGLGVGSLTHAINSSMGNDINIILDIDIYQENTNYDPAKPAAWDLLDKFREQKNRVFFAAVNEKALEKFL